MPFPELFSRALSGMQGNIIREIAKQTAQPGFISFAGGNPSADTFPAEELADIAAEVLVKKKVETLQYGVTEGYLPLREWIAGWVKEKGINATPAQIQITTGSQQGIDLLSKVFLNPGDRVLVEDPTYLAAIQIFRVYEAVFDTIASDEDGLIIESLQEAAEKDPHKLLYLVPGFQNPTGRTITDERRRRIPDILAEHNLIMIEDDPYGDLRYSGEAIPPVKAYDTENRIVYLGSFSKILAPGLRVGYAIGDPEIMKKLAVGKQTADLHGCSLTQVMIDEFLRRGLLPAHLERLRAVYKKKRDLMLQLLDAHFPAEVSWTKPDGGLFIWMILPNELSSMELLQKALQEKIAFIPGGSFFARGGGSCTLRLNFSNANEEQMEKGLARLGKITKDFISKG